MMPLSSYYNINSNGNGYDNSASYNPTADKTAYYNPPRVPPTSQDTRTVSRCNPSQSSGVDDDYVNGGVNRSASLYEPYTYNGNLSNRTYEPGYDYEAPAHYHKYIYDNEFNYEDYNPDASDTPNLGSIYGSDDGNQMGLFHTANSREVDRYVTPIESVRTPTESVPNPVAASGEGAGYDKAYSAGAYDKGYQAGLAACRNQPPDLDTQAAFSSTGAQGSQPGGVSVGGNRMLLADRLPQSDYCSTAAHPTVEGHPAKYQNQFAPVNPSAGGGYQDNYSHGGLPMNSGHLPSTGLSISEVGSGKGSGRMGTGTGTLPGLANVN